MHEEALDHLLSDWPIPCDIAHALRQAGSERGNDRITQRGCLEWFNLIKINLAADSSTARLPGQ